MSSRRSLRDEAGLTLVELMVSISIGVVVLLGVFAMIDTTSRGSARINDRVAANQVARPALQRIMDRLHSGCVAPGVSPVLAGSDDDSLALVHHSGSEVNPTPVEVVVALDANRLTETSYPVSGGAAPDWTFATTPSSTYEILDRVSLAALGDPPTPVPVFQYYAYVDGVIPGTRLATPLSEEDAAQAVQVTVAFAVSPASTAVTPDPDAAQELTDSAILRFTPPSEDTTEANLPCE